MTSSPNYIIDLCGRSELRGPGVKVTGTVRQGHDRIVLVALGNRSRLEVDLHRSPLPLKIDLAFDLQVQSGNTFYTGITTNKETYRFRITRDNFVFCQDTISYPTDLLNKLTVQMYITKDKWFLLLDNKLQIVRDLNAGENEVKSLFFDLLEDSADLDAAILQARVQEVDERNVEEIYDQLFNSAAKETEHLIAGRKFPELIGFLKGIPAAAKFASAQVETLLSQFASYLQDNQNQHWMVNEISELLGDKSLIHKLEVSLNRTLPPALVEVKDLSIQFNKNAHKKFSVGNLFSRKKEDSYLVLRDINFNAYPGDIIGILGANGAGKSTLLKAIAGLLDISQGEIVIRGHHILLSPGLGMRNELSGRENVFLACCYMGLTPKETEAIYPEILDFSELGEKINMPYKFYSDGMRSRLIFSIATSIAPEILMLDEILGAGDIKFQQKAAKRMDELLQNAKLVLLVTHSIQIVEKKCNKALLISHGNQLFFGAPQEAVNRYLNDLHMEPPPSHSTEYDEKVGFLGELLDE